MQDYAFHLAVACDAGVPWAVVGSVGNPIRGGALIGTTQLSPGRYEVEFNRNVAGCGYTATIGDTANGLVFSPGLVFTAGGPQQPSKVYVETKNPGGGLQQYPFHLAVSCGPSQPWAVVMGNGAGVRAGALVETTRLARRRPARLPLPPRRYLLRRLTVSVPQHTTPMDHEHDSRDVSSTSTTITSRHRRPARARPRGPWPAASP